MLFWILVVVVVLLLVVVGVLLWALSVMASLFGAAFNPWFNRRW